MLCTDTSTSGGNTGSTAFNSRSLNCDVLTGAMIPYKIDNSDAFFNLGFACGVVQLLPAGVYVAMNGNVFAWDNVQKDRSAGVFVPKS